MQQEDDELRPKVADMLENQRVAMARDLAALDQISQRAIIDALAGPKLDLKASSHVAWVATQRAGIVGQLRQLEKHDRVMSKTPAQRFALVQSYLRTEASPQQLAEVAQLVAELTSGRSVLS